MCSDILCRCPVVLCVYIFVSSFKFPQFLEVMRDKCLVFTVNDNLKQFEGGSLPVNCTIFYFFFIFRCNVVKTDLFT